MPKLHLYLMNIDEEVCIILDGMSPASSFILILLHFLSYLKNVNFSKCNILINEKLQVKLSANYINQDKISPHLFHQNYSKK